MGNEAGGRVGLGSCSMTCRREEYVCLVNSGQERKRVALSAWLNMCGSYFHQISTSPPMWKGQWEERERASHLKGIFIWISNNKKNVNGKIQHTEDEMQGKPFFKWVTLTKVNMVDISVLSASLIISCYHSYLLFPTCCLLSTSVRI